MKIERQIIPLILICTSSITRHKKLERILSKAKADVLFCGSIQTAVKLSLNESRVVIIILSFDVYTDSIYKHLKMLRRERGLKLPIIFISSSDDDQSVVRSYASGAIDYIQEPIKPDIFLGKVNLFIQLWSENFRLESKIKQLTESIKLSSIDSLTNLPNRRHFFIDIKKIIHKAKRNNTQFAVVFIDLDDFKKVNDLHGHGVGDELLQQVSLRLTQSIRDVDGVYRLGGDEFVLVMDDIKSGLNIVYKLEELVNAIREPYDLSGCQAQIGASIGVSLYPTHDSKEGALLVKADQAMYKAKQEGKNTYRFFSDKLNKQYSDKLSVELALINALKNKEFDVHYQAIVKVSDGLPTGAEALIRWKNNDLGFVPPDVFIPIAESCGLIYNIGAWVLDEAIVKIKEWHDLFSLPLRIAINVSPIQIQQPSFYELLKKILEENDIDGDCVEIEITEGVLMDNSEVQCARLQSIVDLGVNLSIDDFGTGYSSLSYLKHCPVKTVKIDRSFIHDIPMDKDSCTLVIAILTMAHALGKEVIAEGVETYEQWQFLKQHDCDFAQGYYFSKPISADAFEEYLVKGLERENNSLDVKSLAS